MLKDCEENGPVKVTVSHNMLEAAGSFADACPAHVGLVAELLTERNREALSKLAVDLTPATA
jgi:hypothetical protein